MSEIQALVLVSITVFSTFFVAVLLIAGRQRRRRAVQQRVEDGRERIERQARLERETPLPPSSHPYGWARPGRAPTLTEILQEARRSVAESAPVRPPREAKLRYEVCRIEHDGTRTVWGAYALKRDALREAKLAAANWHPTPVWLVRVRDQEPVLRVEAPKRRLRYSEPGEADQVRDEEEI